jgi:hypothetical protein
MDINVAVANAFATMVLCKYGSNSSIDVYEQKLPWLLGHCDTKEKQPYLLSLCHGSHGIYYSQTSMLLLPPYLYSNIAVKFININGAYEEKKFM